MKTLTCNQIEIQIQTPHLEPQNVNSNMKPQIKEKFEI
jgi:hypothetical protein